MENVLIKQNSYSQTTSDSNLTRNFSEVILSSLPHGITILNTKGQIIFANKAAKKILYTTRLPQKSKPIVNNYEIYDEKGTKLLQKDLPSQKVLLTKKPQERVLRFWHKEYGIETWSQVTSQPLIENGVMIGVINVFHDLTTLKKTESRIAFLNSLSEKLTSSLHYEIRLKKLAEQIVPLIADWCAIDMINSEGKLDRVVISHKDKQKIKLAQKMHKQFPPDPLSMTGTYGVLHSGKVEFHPKITEQMINKNVPDLKMKKMLKKLQLSSVVILPLISRNKKLGVITFAHSESRRQYQQDDISFLKNIATKAALLCDNGKMYTTVVKTLKDQKKIETRLRENKDTLNLALSASRMGVWDWEKESDTLIWTEQLEIIHGLSPKTFKGTFSHFLSLIHPEDIKRVKKELALAIRERKNFEMEYRLRSAVNQHERWIYSTGEVLLNAKGKPVRLTGIGMDITERKNYENEILNREKKFRSIYNSVTEAMFITDTDGIVRDINAGAEKIFSIKIGEPLITQIQSFLDDESNNTFTACLEELNSKGVSQCELTLSQSVDKKLYFDVLCKKNFIPDKNLIVLRDITDLTHEAKRREHFLSIASHELRSPLANIKIYLELLKKFSKTGNPKAFEYITKAEQKVDMVTKLINDLLDVTRIREGKLDLYFEFTETKSYIQNLIKDLQLVVPQHTIIIEKLANETVMIDRIRIAQVITNLVTNAAKYSEPGTTIHISSTINKKYFQVSIRDRGIGLSEKYLPNLFVLYNQGTSTNKSGLGLGLYISKQIINQHGGKMTVKSTIENGSTFTFSLPRETTL